jgi:hypothetical protein
MGSDQVEVLGPAAAWAHLLRELTTDPRVPWHAKVAAGAALIWSTPVPRLLTGRPLPPGAVGDLALVVLGARRLVAAAGYDVVRERWRGDDASFIWLLVLTGIDD